MVNQQIAFFELSSIIGEFKKYLIKDIDFDVITIVGEGEPLLYLGIGNLIRELKKFTDKPIAIITNGALLSIPSIRDDLLEADIVLPSLDAVDKSTFKTINRPHGDISFDNMVEGLIDFSKDFKGQLWIETMIIKGINDNKNFYLRLKDILKKINYERLYLNVPVRPPAESFVLPPSNESLNEAISILGGISIDKLVSEGFYSEIEDDYKAILSIIKRHPMNQFELKTFLEKRNNKDIDNFLKRLSADKNIEVIDYKNYMTYRLK
ncbi:MAG: radical SAM protein [Tissierellaceae bacterium]